MTDNPQTQAPFGDFYRDLVQHAAVALVAADQSLNIVCLNPLAEMLLNVQAQELIGKPIAGAVPVERRKLFNRLIRRTIDRNEPSEFDIRLRDADGEQRNLHVVLSCVVGEPGKASGVAAWIVDQTNRVRLDERLAQAEKMASLGTLAGGVAHHFNNILGGVATFVDFALTSGDISAMRRALQMTAEASSRAANITQSLLSFASKDTQRFDMADLTEVVLTFVHLVERPLAEKNIRAHVDLRPVPILAVEANRMHQVLGNLLTNAEESMPTGGAITIAIDRDGDEVMLTFSDTGCGIEDKHLPLVFEPFFTTKGLLSGGNKANPGLGLSVVHGIVTDMGGRISVDSEAGKWSRFTIHLPMKHTGEQAAT